MAKSNFKKLTSIKDTEGGNFGNYKEAYGGGSPKGGVWGGQNGRVGWAERESAGEVKQGEHRKDQPRTSDGKFTYNSVNGKETKYESRGKTVNPLLTEGKNGIYIDVVKDQFKNKSGAFYERWKDTFYQRGNKLIMKEGRKYVVHLAAHDIIDIARVSFDISKNAFKYETENFDEVKKGRRSKEEKAAIGEARKNKEETLVKSSQPGGGLVQKKMSPGGTLSTGELFALYPGVLSRFRKIQNLRNTLGGTQSASQAPANGQTSQLVGVQKPNLAVNPNVLSNLLANVNKYMTQSVPQAVSQNATKPKLNLSGILPKKK